MKTTQSFTFKTNAIIYCCYYFILLKKLLTRCLQQTPTCIINKCFALNALLIILPKHCSHVPQFDFLFSTSNQSVEIINVQSSGG